MRNLIILTGILFLTACTKPVTSLIQLESPTAGSVIESPLTVRGEAPGNWFFEANIVVELQDANENQIAMTGMMATEEWMTPEMVSFEGTLEFETDAKDGFLIIRKDNSSGLPEHDASESFPVRFR